MITQRHAFLLLTCHAWCALSPCMFLGIQVIACLMLLHINTPYLEITRTPYIPHAFVQCMMRALTFPCITWHASYSAHLASPYVCALHPVRSHLAPKPWLASVNAPLKFVCFRPKRSGESNSNIRGAFRRLGPTSLPLRDNPTPNSGVSPLLSM